MMSVTFPNNAAAAAVAAAAAMAAAQHNNVTANSTNSTKKMGFSIDSIVGNSGAESAASKLRDSLNMSPTDLSLSAAAKRFKSDHHTMDHTRFEYFGFLWDFLAFYFWHFARTFWLLSRRIVSSVRFVKSSISSVEPVMIFRK